MKIDIRELNNGDWELFRSVRLRALRDSPDAFSSNIEREQAFADDIWKSRLADSAAGQFVATSTDDSHVQRGVGMVVSKTYGDDPSIAGLFGMWVDPGVRGQGVGRLLVERVIAWASARDYREILLDVADNNAAAISLYERCGFQPNGVTGALPPPRDHITEHQRCYRIPSSNQSQSPSDST